LPASFSLRRSHKALANGRGKLPSSQLRPLPLGAPESFEPETYTLPWEFDAWLIADQPYHSLTPLQARSPVSRQEAPQRLNECLKRSASAA